MSDTAELEAAAIEAKAARERLLSTASEIQARLDPSTLADEVVSRVKAGAAELAETANEAARRRPGATAGIAAAAALFVLRRPIGRLFRRKRRDRHETERRSRR